MIPDAPWFTAAELAALGLPGLSTAKRKINELATAERWALRLDSAGRPLARPRRGRGGGTEYHVGVLPPAAATELARRGLIGAPAPAPGPAAANDQPAVQSEAARRWAWFDAQPTSVKTEAGRRLAVIDQMEALEATGLTRTAAVAASAAEAQVSPATLWNWVRATAGAPRADRLPLLAPQRKGGGREAEIDAEAWRVFLSDYLRPERPTLNSCYERCLREYCAPRGIELPHLKSLQRKLEREVPQAVIVARRHGAEALRATLPAQSRSVADLSALELVNIDGHRWDVFVRWPDGAVARPIMVAIQDVYSRKVLSWRIGQTESAVLTRLAFADLFAGFGIPAGCLMDNGRAFASKWITGGISNRFRFKVREEEPTGLLTALGVKVHWAQPFRGQSKPIERAFRDLCDHVAKHPRLAGAWTGNRPDNKPENHGSRAIDLEAFRAVVAAGIEAHNARTGRRTEACHGRLSFDQAFQASYAVSAIGRATPEQLRLALLAADQVSTDRRTGEFSLCGNRYWTPELREIAGQRVVVRFDPDHLHGETHVYGLDGRFIATAPVLARTGFLDVGAAKARARQEADLRKATRKAAELQELMTAQDLAAMLPEPALPAPEPMSPTVIRPVRTRGNAALKPAPLPSSEPAEDAGAVHATERWAAAMERMTPHLRVVEP